MSSVVRTSQPKVRCINHPADEPAVLIAPWFLESVSGDHCSAAVLGYFQLSEQGYVEKNEFVDAGFLAESLLGLYGLTSIQAALKSLVQDEFLKSIEYTAMDAAVVCQNKKRNYIKKSFKECSWCFSPSLVLQSHHYPIPKSLGGIDTVDICGSCHAEFHFLVDRIFYAAGDRLMNLIKANFNSLQEAYL